MVQQTHWHNLDLIPSNLGVYGSEFAIAARLRDEEGFAFHRPLAEGLAPLRQDYDVIILDTAPSLSFVNSNAMFAADGLLITLPPAMIDLQSSSLFFELVAEIMEAFNRTEPEPKTYDFASVLLTRVRPNDGTHAQITKWIRQFFPQETCAHTMVQSSALEKVGPELLTLYEVAEYDGDRRTLERAIDAMNSVNGEIETLIRGPCRRPPLPARPRPSPPGRGGRSMSIKAKERRAILDQTVDRARQHCTDRAPCPRAAATGPDRRASQHLRRARGDSAPSTTMRPRPKGLLLFESTRRRSARPSFRTGDDRSLLGP